MKYNFTAPLKPRNLKLSVDIFSLNASWAKETATQTQNIRETEFYLLTFKVSGRKYFFFVWIMEWNPLFQLSII